MGYIIAIDGGGTKTLGVLFTKYGQEIKRSTHGMCNISVDYNQSLKNIKNTIEDLMLSISNKELDFIQIGLAGYINPEITQNIESYLIDIFNIPCNVVQDADIALYSIKRDDVLNTILVIGGTGSIIAYENEGVINYIGGYGHLLGDEGSSYHLVISAIKRLLTKLEVNNQLSTYDQEVLKLFNCKNYRDIIDVVYSNQKNYIANFAIDIATLALNGYDEAKDLFIEEGLLLASQVMKVLSKWDKNIPVKLGFRGSFIQNAPYVKASLINELKKYHSNIEIDYQTESIMGAFYLGLSNFNKILNKN